MAVLDFEKPLVELEERVAALRILVESGKGASKELQRLQKRLDQQRKRIFARLNRWEKVQLARHMDRPHATDYIEGLLDDFVELHGDRQGFDDPAIVAGLGRLERLPVVVMGHEKGRTLAQRAKRNFGMSHPEGNRKILRMMSLAERFNRPILTLVDTPGAYPGVDAEARGQASSIAENLLKWAVLGVPSVAVIIGEGGSGGALAMAMADRVLMLEHSIYSVISPEGCAAILWRDESKKTAAADSLRLSAQDALDLGLIDEIVVEPAGGAHRDQAGAVKHVGEACLRHLNALLAKPKDELKTERFERYRRIGAPEAEA
jgi:acetyl-CoA carboxylase carboxyl transferase subunit alpha